MSTAPKLIKLKVNETSGVDHPAHEVEGWMLMKSRDGVKSVFESLRAAGVVRPEGEDMEVTEELQKSRAQIAALLAVTKQLRAANVELKKQASQEVAPVTVSDDPYAGMPEEVATLMKSRDEMHSKEITKAREYAASVEKELEKARSERETETEIAKARSRESIGYDSSVFGAAMRKARAIDAELAETIDQILDAANEQLRTAGIFKAAGMSNAPAGSALGTLDGLANERLAKGLAKSKSQAIADVLAERPELYTQAEMEGQN